MPIGELPLGSKPVVSVRDTLTALEVFKLMDQVLLLSFLSSSFLSSPFLFLI